MTKAFRIHPSLLLLWIFTLFFGCKAATDPATNAGTGSLTGTVRAFAFAAPQPVSPRGIHVELQATNFTATSDSLGNFRIDNIPAGVYNIIFWRPGFDSMIYPVHHLLGAGTDIINDAYLIQESTDSVIFKSVVPVFTVSVSKIIHIIDTLIKIDPGGGKDTIVRSFDTTIVTYDTVRKPTMLVINSSVTGSVLPKDVYVYSSLDSALYPSSLTPEKGDLTLDQWLGLHKADTSFHSAFQIPRIASGKFSDTLWSDIKGRKPFSFESGQTIYIYAVGHSNTDGLPTLEGQYAHFLTTPYGPQVTQYRYIVP
ncbi:MAG: carboxypeptidase-like regulatory domain-containing protein [Bacteroidota bacterium]|nr:carboxypeptidase-like regulatory domain-containing protein [Bacteroidota bacterium]MDP4230935.1 carboxypeptidase-like regulatory domain-containing protein [Bacteroidota bacterium]MDP4237090.1 carboxypeptidase-like regulatory domain-containing protein [Bacteroidota bacterium]